LNDTTLFEDGKSADAQSTRLQATRDDRPRHTWRDNNIFLRQSLFVGRLDTVNAGQPEQQILPTNRMSHSLDLHFQNFQFYKNEEDSYGAFPFVQSRLTEDTTNVTTI